MSDWRKNLIVDAFATITKAFGLKGLKLRLLPQIGESIVSETGQIIRYWGRAIPSENTVEVVYGVDRAPWEYVATVLHEVLHVILSRIGFPSHLHHGIIYPLHFLVEDLLEDGEWELPNYNSISTVDIETPEDIAKALKALGLPKVAIETYIVSLEETLKKVAVK